MAVVHVLVSVWQIKPAQVAFSAHDNTPCLKKNYAKLFLSELRQISTNFDNCWQIDGKEAEIMRDALIFHLT